MSKGSSALVRPFLMLAFLSFAVRPAGAVDAPREARTIDELIRMVDDASCRTRHGAGRTRGGRPYL